MNREVLHESLSAVMDGEADELEMRRVLADAELSATWKRYQLARAAMHRELLDPRLDLLSGIHARLEAEESVQPPPSEPVVEVRARFKWTGVVRVAVAASVTLAVLAGVRFYNQQDISGAPSMASVSAPVGSVVASSSEELAPRVQVVSEQRDIPGWQEPRVQQNIQQASFNESAPVSVTRPGGTE